jgi:hypothetical protein
MNLIAQCKKEKIGVNLVNIQMAIIIYAKRESVDVVSVSFGII